MGERVRPSATGTFQTPPFVLDSGNAVEYLVGRGLLDEGVAVEAIELVGGVSANVVAVRGRGVRLVVKQALAQLRVERDWRAKQERTEIEAAAMQLCGQLTPGRVPLVIDINPDAHVLVMELLPSDADNWQAEVAAGRAHIAAGSWAGETLALWHAGTAGDPVVARTFNDFESFEQQRLNPFYETASEQLPALESEIATRLEELRDRRVCLVHGDYAMKNMLVGRSGRWVLDFEVAHYGNPVFDLAFFISFVVLSAIRWPALAARMRQVGKEFLAAYRAQTGDGFAGDSASLTAHTACLILARTDGKSPAQFFDPRSRRRSREVGIEMLRSPESGLWAWA